MSWEEDLFILHLTSKSELSAEIHTQLVTMTNIERLAKI